MHTYPLPSERITSPEYFADRTEPFSLAESNAMRMTSFHLPALVIPMLVTNKTNRMLGQEFNLYRVDDGTLGELGLESRDGVVGAVIDTCITRRKRNTQTDSGIAEDLLDFDEKALKMEAPIISQKVDTKCTVTVPQEGKEAYLSRMIVVGRPNGRFFLGNRPGVFEPFQHVNLPRSGSQGDAWRHWGIDYRIVSLLGVL